MRLPLRDRRDAGQQLAEHLLDPRRHDDVVVLGPPRGVIPAACEIATAIGAPLDACVVRRLDVPGHEELAMGAVASSGVTGLNDTIIAQTGGTDEEIQAVIESGTRQLQRRERVYRGTQPPPDVEGRTVVLVDDDIATVTTIRASEQIARPVRNPEHYHRSMFRGQISSWNLRDSHMADTLDDPLDHLTRRTGELARIVVRAHNSHLGDARATQLATGGEHNLGQPARERHGDTVYLIDQTTHHGTVTAVSDWDAPANASACDPDSTAASRRSSMRLPTMPSCSRCGRWIRASRGPARRNAAHRRGNHPGAARAHRRVGSRGEPGDLSIRG